MYFNRGTSSKKLHFKGQSTSENENKMRNDSSLYECFLSPLSSSVVFVLPLCLAYVFDDSRNGNTFKLDLFSFCNEVFNGVALH